MSPHHSDQICLKGHKSLGDADRMEIQKYHGPTDRLTAKHTCISKKRIV